jgi:hypothetical protein
MGKRQWDHRDGKYWSVSNPLANLCTGSVCDARTAEGMDRLNVVAFLEQVKS